jgi:3-deoxy-D-manno-octulosonic-acid transferase
VQVRDAAELERTVGELLENAPRRELLGENALKVVRENQGALQRTVDMIVKNLAGSELYVAPNR